jgi:hypothetical protein
MVSRRAVKSEIPDHRAGKNAALSVFGKNPPKNADGGKWLNSADGLELRHGERATNL